MILIDTNVIVALLDPRDGLAKRARRDLGRLEARPLAIVPAVVCESLLLLPAAHQRRGLRDWLRDARIAVVSVIETGGHEADVFEWLLRYAEHEADYADGCLAVATGLLSGAKVWTYDGEFRTIWRRPDGSRIPLALRSTG